MPHPSVSPLELRALEGFKLDKTSYSSIAPSCSPNIITAAQWPWNGNIIQIGPRNEMSRVNLWHTLGLSWYLNAQFAAQQVVQSAQWPWNGNIIQIVPRNEMSRVNLWHTLGQ